MILPIIMTAPNIDEMASMMNTTKTNNAEWIRIPALSDNYIWLLRNPSSEELAIIDPGDAAAVITTLDKMQLLPTEIINTHHHDDHIDGNAELMEKYAIPLTAPASTDEYIANITTPVVAGANITIAGYSAEVIETPGHTASHLAFYLPDCLNGSGIAFVGDNLTPLGCGRVFEGAMDEMWASLLKLRALPDNTLLCGGHEYAAANADYVETLGWARPAATARIAEIRLMHAANLPTMPVPLGVEKAANPFLNCDADDLANALGANALGIVGHDSTAVFTTLREGKDNFQPN